jgi:hypothetical protein
MKITAFNPLILSPKADEVVEVLEALGFERAHTKTGINGGVTSVDLKYGEDFRVDVAGVDKFPQDMTVIRMNVRDFDEAYDFLISKGFTHQSGRVVETETNKSAMLKSPSGFAFDLCQHIRK